MEMNILLNKKIMLISIFLLSLLAVGAVSASTDADDTLNSESSEVPVSSMDIGQIDERSSENDDMIVESDEDGVVGALSNNEVTGTEKPFSDLEDLINQSDEVILDSDYIKGEPYTTNISEGILIDKNLTIDGAGHSLYCYEFRAFNLTQNANLTLKNLIICGPDDCSVGMWGGFVYNHGGALTIINCTFIRFQSKSNLIYSDGGIVTIINSSISNFRSLGLDFMGIIYNHKATFIMVNSIVEENFLVYGAIYNYESMTTIIGSRFCFNDLDMYGIITGSGERDSLYIINSTFEENRNVGDGGAINCMATSSIYIINSTLKENSARRGGAIFYLGKGLISVINSTLEYNTASQEGCAIYASNLIIDNSELNHNNPNNVVGIMASSIYAQNSKFKETSVVGSFYLNEDNIFIVNPKFKMAGLVSNGSTKIYLAETANNLSFNGMVSVTIDSQTYDVALVNGFAEFELLNPIPVSQKNKATLRFNGTELFDPINSEIEFDITLNSFADLKQVITSSIKEGNNAILVFDYIRYDDDSNEAIVIDGKKLHGHFTIDGTGHTIDARAMGGIFEFTNGAQVTLKNLKFINGAAQEGGAIYSSAVLTILNCTFENNRATERGGAIYIEDDEFIYTSVIKDSTFINNDAEDGGAIFTRCFLEITNTIINNNTAALGAIFNYMHLTVKNCTLENNNVKDMGGAIMNGNSLDLINSKLNNNHATFGAAVYSTSILTVNNCTFNNNTASRSGTIYVFGGLLNMGCSEFNSNHAYTGGAIFIYNGEITIDGSSFKNNDVTRYGAAIYIYKTPYTLIISNSNIENNYAVYRGAAIYNCNAGTITILNSSLSNNKAVEGGAIFNYCKDGAIIISNSTLDNNHADNVAGAIYSASMLNITGSKLNNNSAHGAGAILNAGVLNVVKSTLNCNNAVLGGAIYNNHELKIINSTFGNNSANMSGGAIRNEAILNIIGSLLYNNSAGSSGGAIYNDGTLQIDNSTFNNNSAFASDGDGGAISSSGKLMIFGSSLNSNHAIDVGGAIVTNDDLTIFNSTLNDNYARAGGAVCNLNNATLTISYSTLDNNYAVEGGAIYNNGDSILRLTNSTIQNNVATYGSAIFASTGENIKILHDMFIDNLGDYDGVYAVEGSIDRLNSKFLYSLKFDISILEYVDAQALTIHARAISKDNFLGGSVDIMIGMEVHTLTFMGRNAVQTIKTNLTHGNYTARIMSKETQSYIFVYSESNSFTVLPDPEITMNISNIVEDTPLTISIESNYALNDELNITIDGTNYPVSMVDGYGAITIRPILSPGDYQATIRYVGNGSFSSKTFNSNLFTIINKTSFLALNISINGAGDSLVLNKDYIYNWEYDSKSINGITINKNLTIDGAGHSIDANGQSRIFTVIDNACLTIINLTLKNGNAIDGGAICNHATLLVSHSDFINNTADRGGAIYNDAVLLITDSNFKDNFASDGGAVYNAAAGSLNLTNSILENNAANHGGAVYNRNTLKVTDSIFKYNEATDGGAIYNRADLEVFDSVFKYNVATRGNAISTYTAKDVEINNSKFIDNEIFVELNNIFYLDKTGCRFLSEVAFEISHIDDFVNGSNITINVVETMTNDFNGSVVVSIGSDEYVIDIIGGSGSKTITPNADFGKQTAKLSFTETSEYESATAESNMFHVSVNPKITLNVSDFEEGSLATIYITANPSFTDEVNITINGVNYAVNVVNGSANKKITANLTVGAYSAIMKYCGNENFTSETLESNFTVTYMPKVVMNQLTVLYTAKYSVTVYGKDGKFANGESVVFYVDGKMVKTVKTNANGVATFNMLDKYVPASYTIKAIALGKSESKRVNVKQILTIKKVKVKKSAKKLVLTATLKKVDGKYIGGKKIIFNFNGKKSTAKTNAKGVAKVTIKKSVLKKLKAGKKVKYSATYLKTTVKMNIKVKK